MLPETSIDIAGRKVGSGAPCFVIAEAGVNHGGSLDMGLRLIDASVEAGADAVKFQSFVADRLATPTAPKAAYQKVTTAFGESQLQMLRRLELSETGHRRLIEHCRARGIMFLSTPFDESSADLLESLNVPAFKISSGDLTNTPFLTHVARKQLPILLSTGMSTIEEVGAALEAIFSTGNRAVALFHCVSAYPADAKDANLNAMRTLASAFALPTGYSDHTLGPDVALAAVALGACMLEKHLTMDRTQDGPDHAASTEPQEFSALVTSIRRIESALGDGHKRPVAAEGDVAAVARKSLVAAVDLLAGTELTADVLVARRPGTGLPPSERSRVVGRRVNRDVTAGTPLTPDMLL
jgi:N,N'-diacetyllegionaminate synthase